MARINNLTNFLTDVANAIRSKTGKSETIACEDFDTEIESIESGGANLQTKSITITSNGTTSVTPDINYDGLSSVSITTNVPTGGDTPEKGFVVNEWDTNGYPKNITLINMEQVPAYYFYGYNATNGIGAKLETTNLGAPNKIGTYAFYNCANLKNVVLSNQLSSIDLDAGAFNNCSALQTINLPARITDYNKAGVFQGCTNLILSSMPDTNNITLGNYYFYNCSKITIFELPTAIKYIGNSSFENCSNITISKLNDNTTYVNARAFYNCSKITISNLEVVSTTIGASAFYGCSLITPTKLSDTANVNILANSNSVFEGCSSITKFDLTTSQYVPVRAFRDCTNLVSVIMEGAKNIYGNTVANAAFYNDTSLKAVWIGNGITSNNFQRYVFQGCSNLEYIYINLPRATVQAFSYYSTKWSNNTVSSTCQVICNDDSGFIDATTFRNTDWALV